MAMPQRDETIEEIKWLDALLEYAAGLPTPLPRFFNHPEIVVTTSSRGDAARLPRTWYNIDMLMMSA